MTRFTLLLAVAGLTLSACSSGDTGQDSAASTPGGAAEPATSVSGSSEPDPTYFSSYPLDMDKMKKWVTTEKHLRDAGKKDPTLAAVFSLDQSTYSGMVAKYEGNATVRDALSKAGWSARDYIYTTAAWTAAVANEMALTSIPDFKLEPGHSMRNIEFVKANKNEVERMTKAEGL